MERGKGDGAGKRSTLKINSPRLSVDPFSFLEYILLFSCLRVVSFRSINKSFLLSPSRDKFFFEEKEEEDFSLHQPPLS